VAAGEIAARARPVPPSAGWAVAAADRPGWAWARASAVLVSARAGSGSATDWASEAGESEAGESEAGESEGAGSGEAVAESGRGTGTAD
jgi:hypothetical protein